MRSRGHAIGFSCLCLLAVFIPSLRALDPAKTIFQFNRQNWSRSNGLPAGKINTVTQTSAGYIWLGTQNGLVRFDGLESRAGGLLLAINDGGFVRCQQGKFEAITDPGWPASISGKDIVETRDGAVWIATNLGIGRAAAIGEGIPAENLTRIFSHGCTTKKDGHGFGLHGGSLAAKQLGGELIARSKGFGTGAAFTLELPRAREPHP